MQEIGKLDFAEFLYEGLQKTFKNVDVSATEIKEYMEQNHMMIPDEIDGFEGLLDIMCERHGGITRNNGFGTPTERHVMLMETEQITPEVREKVQKVVLQFLGNREEVKGSELGNIFRSNGILYEDFQYPDLTAFLRNFPELFLINAVPVKNVAKITLRINQKSLQEISLKYGNIFLNKLTQLLREEKYNSIVEKENLQQAMKGNNAEVWEIILKAEAYLENKTYSIEKKEQLTEWEKMVITFAEDLEERANDVEFMARNGFSKEQAAAIRDGIRRHPEVNKSFAAMGLRVQNLCGADNILALYFFQLGMKAEASAERNNCCRLLMLYCADFHPELFDAFWELYKNHSINNSTMKRLVEGLYEKKHFQKVITVVDSTPQKVNDYRLVTVYYDYAQMILRKESGISLPSLVEVGEYLKNRIMFILLDSLWEQQRFQQFCRVIYLIWKEPEEYISKISLDGYLQRLKHELFAHWESLFECVKAESATEGCECWTAADYLVQGGFVEGVAEEWEQFSTSYRESLTTAIQAAKTEAEKQVLLNKMMFCFPSDNAFVEDSYQVLKMRLEQASPEEKESILGEMIKAENGALLLCLYERQEILLEEETEFLAYVSERFAENDKLQQAILAKYQEIMSCRKKNVDTKAAMTVFINLLGEASLRGNRVQMDNRTADAMLAVCEGYQCSEEQLSNYRLAIMGLALKAEKPLLAALLYVLMDESEKETNKAFTDSVSNAVLKKWTNREHFRFGNLAETYKFVLMTEDMDAILRYAGFVAVSLQYDSFERKIEAYRFLKAENLDELSLIKMSIVNYDKKAAWDCLAHYSWETGNYHVNYTANLIAIYRFANQQNSLKWCENVLEKWPSDSIPPNFLANNLLLLKKYPQIINYWQAFKDYVIKNRSFAYASEEMINAYFTVMADGEDISVVDCSRILCILEQTNRFDLFFEAFRDKKDEVDACLLRENKNIIRFLTMFVCATQWEANEPYLERVNEIRNKLRSCTLKEQDKAALLWMDELFERRTDLQSREAFFEASRAVLITYPKEPDEDIVKRVILPYQQDSAPDYILIRYWLNTFGSYSDLTNTYRYLGNQKLPYRRQERIARYGLLVYILRRMILSGKEQAKTYRQSYLRLCKNYLAACYLAEIPKEVTKEFQCRMEEMLQDGEDYCYYAAYQKELERFWNSNIGQELKQKTLACGISQYWNDFLEELLFDRRAVSELGEHFTAYVWSLDYRSFRRCLLLLYLSSNLANMQANQQDTRGIAARKISGVKKIQTRLQEGKLIFRERLSVLQQLAEAFCPMLVSVMIDVSERQDGVEWLKMISFVLDNKKWKELAYRTADVSKEVYEAVMIPCLAALQYQEDVAQIMEEWADSSDERFLPFVSDSRIREVLGGFLSDYDTAFYWLKKKQYEKAGSSLPAIEDCPDALRSGYEKLKIAIEQRKLIARSDIAAMKTAGESLPRFSFMSSLYPQEASFEQLKADFFGGDNLYDAGMKCKWAQQIYYYLAEGRMLGDIYQFAFLWGFYAIENEYDVERQARILFELIDHIPQLRNKEEFGSDLVKWFQYILNAFVFPEFAKNLTGIETHFNLLYKEYHTSYVDLGYYAELIHNLSEMHVLLEKNADVEQLEPEIDRIEGCILAIRSGRPNDHFARKSVDFLDNFKHQLYTRGLFEMRILNENREYDGTIFYQVKNVGFETIPQIALTLYLDGYQQETISNIIRIEEEIPGGLRPNQIYAGEYAPGEEYVPGKIFEEGCELKCILQLEYQDKEQTVVSARTEETLTAHGTTYVYHKKGGAGYSTETINTNTLDRFVGRTDELEEIVGNVDNYKNILLFGTNGTGKSSILNALSGWYIRELCRSNGQETIFINLFFNDDCTEKEVIERLLNTISSKNCTLFKEVDRLSKKNADRDYGSVKTDMEAVINSREEIEIVTEHHVIEENMVELFKDISRIMVEASIRLFIVWDNFEKVISSPYINPTHMSFLRTLKETPNAMDNIQFIFSGSNYLLEAVSISGEYDSWNGILTRCTAKTKIGNLCEKDFKELMSQKKALNNGEIHYSEEALQYLWKYTNGHAFYSCFLGNQTLDILSSRAVKRDCIYPSDVFTAIYRMQKDSDASDRMAIENQIFQDISENIAVKYVGKVIADFAAKGSGKITRQSLQEKVLHTRTDISKSDFDTALAILGARDFVQIENTEAVCQEKEKADEWDEFYFTSDLYLEYFLHTNVPPQPKDAKETLAQKKQDIFDMLYYASPETIEQLRLVVGNSVKHIGINNVFESGAQQNNIQIVIQNMTNAFTTILSGASGETLLEAYHALPQIQDYQIRCLDDKAKEQMESIKAQLLQETDEESRSGLELELEEIQKPAVDEMCKDYVHAIAGAEDFLPEELDDSRLKELLHISDTQLRAIKLMPSEFRLQFGFATILHSIFDRFEETDSIDYCPVTLMYCKLVEATLKKLHTELYIERLPDSTIRKGSVTFSVLGDEQQLRAHKKELTIGSYVHPIAVINQDDITLSFAKMHKLELLCQNDDKLADWERHAIALAKVSYCRNKSAHESIPITMAELEDLVRLLFTDGELNRIIDLAHNG